MSEALKSLERKCSDTVVGLELFVCFSTGCTIFRPSFCFFFVLFLAAVAFSVFCFQSQTYPEEERACLSKYWKIYFPDCEISLVLFLDYLFFITSRIVII